MYHNTRACVMRVLYVPVNYIPYSRENNDRLFYSKIAHLCGTDYVG